MSYTSGIINIPIVTGNIVITAVAASVTVTSISAVFNQGNNKVYTTDTLDSLKQYLTVTASYSNGTSGVVTGYTLSGTLTKGTSTITVSYGGQTTTFTVTVSVEGIEDLPDGYEQVEWMLSSVVQPASPTRMQITNVPIDDVLEIKFNMIHRGGGGQFLSASATGTAIAFYNGSIYYDLNNVRAGMLSLTENAVNTVRVGNLFVESVELGTSKTNTTQTGIGNVTWGLETASSFESYQAQQIKYVKQYHNDTLVRYLVPCIRTADDQAGYYDVVQEEFIYGTGTHTTGEVIS